MFTFGDEDSDFTPQNKPVENLIRSYYSSERHIDPSYHFKNRIKVLEGVISAFTLTLIILVALTIHYAKKSRSIVGAQHG